MPSRWSSSCWITRASNASASNGDRLAVGRERLDRDERRAPHVRGQVGDAEAALAAELVALGAHDHRVREHEQAGAALGLRVAGHVDRDEPDELADLRRREADAARVAPHRVDEVGGDPRAIRLGVVDSARSAA